MGDWLKMMWMYMAGDFVREIALAKYVCKGLTKVKAYYGKSAGVLFPEYRGKNVRRIPHYSKVESYLTSVASKAANTLTATVGKGDTKLLLTLGDNEEIEDEYQGVKVQWSSIVYSPNTQNTFYPTLKHRFYELTYNKKDRDIVLNHYINHVLREGEQIGLHNRQRKLYTNNVMKDAYDDCWTEVLFQHPASFTTLAMEPAKKREIMADLDTFRNGKDYYYRIGKAWKRGYLLFGPPGTGKSTMIAAMANYMDYDIYDIELTIVKNNTDLRRLLIETTSKSIIVFEDIDCSLDVTGKRKQNCNTIDEDSDDEEKDKKRKVTLSGLLNFIDGLWSSCGGERLIVFTTNHVEKLDPALIRRGRMDKHIEMSYCGFEAFKILAHNYLGIDSHPLYETIERLIGETKITPADVAENLMPKSSDDDPETCLHNLISVLMAPQAEEKSISSKAEEEEEEEEGEADAYEDASQHEAPIESNLT